MTERLPKVAVCMPTRNRSGMLRQAIRSVLAQTYADFVLFVSDNASTDDTPAVVAEFRDPRLQYIRLEQDIGLVGNHNQLLDRVEAEYVLILPDDDIAYPELLEHTVRVLDHHPSAGMVHSNCDMIGPEGEILHGDVNWTHGLTEDHLETGHEFIRESMKYSCRVCASTALMRRDALPAGYFDPADFPPVDLGLWLRMAVDWDMAFTAKVLAGYRIHDATHSAAFNELAGHTYMQTIDLIRRHKELKLRFVERFADRLSDPEELGRLADASMRRELLTRARLQTVPERKFRQTISAVREAVAAHRGMLLEWGAWRLIAGSVLGPEVTRHLLSMRRGRPA